ncbi:MAG: hypothetical protein ABJN42_16000 [Roseibium sp.]|uniref:hypothetical protein n=1 Tax=Roseibium sp. TaxID=1936156 RepID=UPI003296D94E
MPVNLHQKYHDLANEVFNPNLINDPDDFDALYNTCKRLMRENGMMCPEDPDGPEFDAHRPVTEEHPVMSFIYRAQALCELGENGFVYHREGDDYVLETMANTTAKCFDREADAAPGLS